MPETILTTLSHMTLAATVAALVILVLRLPLKRAPRWITCALWAVVLLRMLCPVSFELPVSLTAQVTDRIPAVTETIPSVEMPSTETYSPESVPVDPAASQPVTPAVQPVGPGGTEILFALWLTGAAAMLLWAVLSYGHLRKKVADAILTEAGVYETDQVPTPFVCGFLKPRIYLPADLDPADRTYVLLHERAHIRRRDYLTKPLAWLALSLHWFNPVLWLAYKLYCRDVETACDQAVVRNLGQASTADYAAALLHLGRKKTLPAAVPLAFGEEDAKGRVRHILDYRYPGFWVIVVTIVVALLAGFILLADQQEGRHGEQLEGIAITRAAALSAHGEKVALPDHLTRTLVRLLDHYGHDEYVTTADTAAMEEEGSLPHVTSVIGQNTVLMGGPNAKGTSYSFNTNTLVLLRHSGDVYSPKDKKAWVDIAILEDPDYQAWLADFAAFQTNAFPDQLYDLCTPYLGDNSAVIAILDALGVRQVGGQYTVQLHTDAEPYTIDVILPGWPAFAQDQAQVVDYLRACGHIFLTLVGNAEEISFIYEIPNGTVGQSVAVTEEIRRQREAPQESFRAYYDSVMPQDAPLPNHFYTADAVTWLSSAPQSPGALCLGYPTWETQVRVTATEFDVTIASPFSSAWPAEVKYDDVLYALVVSPPNLVAPDGQVLLAPSAAASAEVLTVLSHGQPTGYTLYRLDGKTHLSCANPATGTLDYVIELQLTSSW